MTVADPFLDLDAYVRLPRLGGLWLSPDGRRLLVKLLPEGQTLESAARLLPTSDATTGGASRTRRDSATARVYSALPDSAGSARPGSCRR